MWQECKIYTNTAENFKICTTATKITLIVVYNKQDSNGVGLWK